MLTTVGMAKAVADVDSGSNQGGFTTDPGGNVTGFSTMHDSGTGMYAECKCFCPFSLMLV